MLKDETNADILVKDHVYCTFISHRFFCYSARFSAVDFGASWIQWTSKWFESTVIMAITDCLPLAMQLNWATKMTMIINGLKKQLQKVVNEQTHKHLD